MAIPHLVYADNKGRILDHPSLLMLGKRGDTLLAPEKSELIPLPEESELFFLPGRLPLGLDQATGQIKECQGFAVSAFAAPGYTLAAHPACRRLINAPDLPLFAYGAVGYAENRFWIWASKVDDDTRQQFARVSEKSIAAKAGALLRKYPKNRLVRHILNNCVARYGCPAAKNFALGRHEAPLPTSRACNSSCLGCISAPQSGGAAKTTPQCRLGFTPETWEIIEVMRIHEQREKARPIYSFGQGCEGDPLHNWPLLAESVASFRKLRESGHAGHGTVNCNTNASIPEGVAALCEAGLTSLRVSLNSANPELYHAYYRPRLYNFEDVKTSMRIAARAGVFVSLNYLWFPGLTDTEEELAALAELCRACGVSMIQWRNLNVDPDWLWQRLGSFAESGKSLGLARFRHELGRLCPWLRHGYFNPWLGDKAKLAREI